MWQERGVNEMAGDRPPLDATALRDLALRYVGRFATSEAKLRRYLGRKLFERGWSGDAAPPVEAIVARLAELGYVDDRGFAEARARGLTSRGFGARRVAADLGAAGIAREVVAEVASAGDAVAAATAFARRRRLGPFDPHPSDPERRRKAFAAMMRAGHGVAETRQVLAAPPDDD